MQWGNPITACRSQGEFLLSTRPLGNQEEKSPILPERIGRLYELASNLWWSWHEDGRQVFRSLDYALWRISGHNPVKLLGGVSQQNLEALAENKGFLCQLRRAEGRLNSYLEGATWFEKVTSESNKPLIAYFSAEFGIHESLPIYSGGLGILAGDHLKSASDLGIPLIGVGLLYQKWYFRQYLNIDGWQQEVFPTNDWYNMQVTLVTGEDGEPIVSTISLAGE